MPSVTVRRRTRGYSALPPVPTDLLSSTNPDQNRSRAGSTARSERGELGSDTGESYPLQPIVNNEGSGNDQTLSASLPASPNRPSLQSRPTNLIPPPVNRTLSSSSFGANTQRRSRSKTIQSILGDDEGPASRRYGSAAGSGGPSFERSGGDGAGYAVDNNNGKYSAILMSTDEGGIGEEGGAVALGPIIPIGTMLGDSGFVGQDAIDGRRERSRTLATPGGEAQMLHLSGPEVTTSLSSPVTRERATTIANPTSPRISTSRGNGFGPTSEAIASAESGQSSGMASVGVRFPSSEKDQMRRISGENQGGLVDGAISGGTDRNTAAGRRRSGSNASSKGATGTGTRGRRSTLSNVFSFGPSSPASERGNPIRRAEDGMTDEERLREAEEEHHEDQVVEHLDVIDPEISAVSHLQNAGNSLMFPPGLFNRRPVLDLPSMASERDVNERQQDQRATNEKQNVVSASTDSSAPSADLVKTDSRHSHMMEDPLDTHVKDVLSKRDLIKRSLKGVWVFLKTPLGVVMGIYGFLVVFWGAAIVLFLFGWINTGSHYNKILWIEISSQIENGLFTITGVGLIPWRYMDVYRISQIYSLKRRSRELRKKRGLPPIEHPDDLPDPLLDPNFVQVLTDKDQALLRYQQEKFMASQTWYRPHATETHTATPIGWGLVICLCILGNSLFQVALDGCMWGFNRFNRPAATTGSLMPASFLCGIGGAILIWRIGERTKKKKEVKRRLRRALGMVPEENVSSTALINEKEQVKSTPPIPNSNESDGDGDSHSDAGTQKSATAPGGNRPLAGDGRDERDVRLGTSGNPLDGVLGTGR